MYMLLIIKHVLRLLNAYVCVYVCMCDDIIPTEFAAHASQPTFLQGDIRLVQVFVTLCT